MVETGLKAALMRDGTALLEDLLNHLSTPKGTKGRSLGRRCRQVQSVLGTFTLKREYIQTADRTGFPLDEQLGLVDRYTPGLVRLMLHAGAVDASFEQAEGTLRRYAGLEVSARQIQRMVQQIGPGIPQQMSQRGVAPAPPASVLYVAVDGTGVPMRKEAVRGRKGKQADGTARTREVKLGCVFTQLRRDENGEPVRDPQSTSYIADFSGSESLGLRLRQEAQLRGIAHARHVAFLGDGAAWVWNLARQNFPQATAILDFYHACEHLHQLTSWLYPTNPQQAKSQARHWIRALKANGINRVIAQATRGLPQHGIRRAEAQKEIRYLQSNASRMRYKTFRSQGLFIGSGVVEAGCKTVVGQRTKQSGMFWNVPRAENVLHLRCAIFSRCFDQFEHLSTIAAAA